MHHLRTVVLCVSWVVSIITMGGCNSHGEHNSSTTHGSLITDPPLRVAHLTASDFESALNSSSEGQRLLLLAGTPQCGIDVHYI
jgi:hypothetical protein